MPRLMEKNDWMRAVANVGSAECVWCDDVSSSVGVLPLSIPEDGHYQVILVKISPDAPSVHPERKSAHDFIGYARKYHPEWHSTADIMKELREGEEDR